MSTPRRSRIEEKTTGRRRRTSPDSRSVPPREVRRRKPDRPKAVAWLIENVLLVCLAVILTLAFLAEMPWLSRPLRTFTLEADVVLLFTLIAAAGPTEGRAVLLLQRRLNPWALALLAWAGLCAFLAPYHAFAIAELLRLSLGAGVYFAVAYVLRPHETRLLPSVLLGLGAAVGLYGLIQFGTNTHNDEVTSIFGNHEQFGSLLALLFPPALALALDRERPPRELLFAQGAALVLGAALLLARTRSAWAGAAVGCVLLSLLALRYAPVRLNRSNKALLIGPALVVVLAFVGLLAFSELAPLVSKRAATLSHALEDTSFSDRLHRWRSACRMASEHPVAGWGLGAWPVTQGRWTHQGDDASEVVASGTGHSNLAHNFWVQWAAETGGVGLALHVALVAAFFGFSLRALPRLKRERRTLLLACLAGVASGCADMIGAPSYTFPGVSSLFWLWIGLGMAQVRTDEGRESGQPRRADWLVSGGLGLAAALVVLGLGWKLRLDGQTVPRGALTVTAEPAGPVAPGTRVLWTATYHAPNGGLRPTAPGTAWTTEAGRLEKTSPTYISVNADPQRSGWQGDVPADTPPVTVTAHYWDNFSREYRVSQTVDVNSSKNPIAKFP